MKKHLGFYTFIHTNFKIFLKRHQKNNVHIVSFEKLLGMASKHFFLLSTKSSP